MAFDQTVTLRLVIYDNQVTKNLALLIGASIMGGGESNDSDDGETLRV